MDVGIGRRAKKTRRALEARKDARTYETRNKINSSKKLEKLPVGTPFCLYLKTFPCTLSISKTHFSIYGRFHESLPTARMSRMDT